MYYSIMHKTRFRYSSPVSESVTEVRMQPRSEGSQRCLNFKLTTSPNARVHSYSDSYGNIVHHFDIPAPHKITTITAEALVILPPPPSLPEALAADDWELLDSLTREEDYWDFLSPSHFARQTPLLAHLASEIEVYRHADPLPCCASLMHASTPPSTTSRAIPRLTRRLIWRSKRARASARTSRIS